ncbi:ABC transporter substrate-binding protein [Chelativorans alearense]|uniref:ABC transporter substrate-binding protein n=1 Tax=Chelativorans alearense TaxID=2681495 RepID=UPI0013D358FA
MQRRTFGRLVAAAGILLASTALTIPTTMAQSEKTITGGFDVGPGGYPGNFHPHQATAGFTWLSTYYEPLVIYNPDLSEIVGALAADVSISEDSLQYTFKLADAKWHDGEPFTSADVKFSLELAKNPDSGSLFAARLGDIASVEAPNDSTAVVTLGKPNAAFLAILTQVMMLPEHLLGSRDPAELANSDWWSTEPVGTGPFKFVQYVSDQYVELAAFDDYRNGRPKVDRLINRYFANAAAAVAALKAGEIQFTYVEPDDAKTFEGNDGFRVIEGDSYVVNYIGFNHKVDLWQDVRVRQAVMYAIDRDQIIESLYGGAAKVASCGYVAPQIVPGGLNDYAYDPEKAKALLAEAGWDQISGGETIPWLTYYNSPQVGNVMAAIQAMLAQVGINVSPRAVDVPTYNGIVRGTDWDQFPLVYAGAQNGPNPASLNVNLNAAQVPPVGNNIMHIDMPELTEAIETAMAETDTSKSNELWQQVCGVMNEKMPWGSMWVASRYGVASANLKDFYWTPAPAGGPYQAHPENWDIAP